MSETDDADDPRALRERVAQLEERLDQLTAPDDVAVDGQGREWSLGDLLSIGLTRRQAMYAFAFISGGYAFPKAISYAIDTASAATAAGQVGASGTLVDVYAASVVNYQWLEPPVVATTGSTYDIDCAAGAVFILTLDADVTFSFSNVDTSDANSVYLKLIQDSTGSRTPSWPSNVQWPNGSEPSWSTSAGAEDVVTLVHDPDNDVWDGFPGGLGMA